MSSRLDRLESRLQALIESSLNRLPWRNSQPRLAADLVSSLRAQLALDDRSTEPLPDSFNLFMHPENCKAWEVHSDWVNWLNRVLLDMAAESNRSYARDPEIRFIPDSDLDGKSVRTVLTYQDVDVNSTAVMAAESDPIETSHAETWSGPYLMLENSKTYPINQTVINIGRREDNDLVLPDPRVSREHAQIRIIHGECVLFDLNSTGGTSVNGRRVNTHNLRPGDVISLAGVNIIFGQETPAGSQTTGTSPAQLPS